MINKLYQCKNKNDNTILIVAKDENEVIEISLELGFVKSKKNLKIKDFTNEYLNKSRQQKGLNYDNLMPGQFFQIINNKGESSWTTYRPEKKLTKKVKI